MAMLNKWKQKFGKKATVEVLRKALEEIERVDLSERVEDKMRALTVQLPPTEGGLDPLSIGTGSSWQSRRETSPNLAETTPTQRPLPESLLNTLRHR